MTNSSSTPAPAPQPWYQGLDRLRWSHAALILTAVFVAANWPVFSGAGYEKWDAYDLAAPGYSLLADFIRAGRLIYWNPWVAGGSPDFAVPGSATFSPDVLLYAALAGPGARAYQFYWLLGWLSGGMGMLLLARHLRAPVWGGLAVTLGFLFSGFYTGHAEHNSAVYAQSLLPWIIWRLDVAVLERRPLAAAQAGALWGLVGLSGYPALTVYTVGLIVAWAAGRCWLTQGDQRARSAKHALLSVLGVGAVGILVLSPTYLSAAYEGRGYSDRSGPLPREYALRSNALHPGTVATLASPSLIELPVTEFESGRRTLWKSTDLSSINLYSGSITLLLAVIALGGADQRRWRWSIFVAALLALACAMSASLPVRGWIYDLVPPTQYFRHSAMIRGYFLFLLAVLALFGSKDLARWRIDPSAVQRLSGVAPLLAVAATIAFVVTITIAEAEHPGALPAQIHLLATWGGLTTLALLLRRNRGKFAAFIPALLLILATADALAAYHFSRGTIYTPGPRPALEFPVSSSVDPGPAKFRRAPGAGEANLNLNFKIATLNNYAPFENKFHEAIVADPLLASMALGENRIWFSASAPEVAPTVPAFIDFRNRIHELNAPVIVRHSREAMLSGAFQRESPTPPALTAARALPTRIVAYQCDKLVLETDAPADGWLMITDRWSRSWNATVNGTSQAVSAANFIFRAVPVLKGPNHVELSFQPLALPALIYLSWGVLAAVLLLSMIKAKRQREVPGGSGNNQTDRPDPTAR